MTQNEGASSWRLLVREIRLKRGQHNPLTLERAVTCGSCVVLHAPLRGCHSKRKAPPRCFVLHSDWRTEQGTREGAALGGFFSNWQTFLDPRYRRHDFVGNLTRCRLALSSGALLKMKGPRRGLTAEALPLIAGSSAISSSQQLVPSPCPTNRAASSDPCGRG
jgi:hypothetical protein